jgi:small GTP-binding protein
MSEHPVLKLIVVGNSGVGKTLILRAFVHNQRTQASGGESVTIGAEFNKVTRRLGTQDVDIQLWDTAGQEKFAPVVDPFYRGAQGVILVFDVTHGASFDALTTNWLPKINHLCAHRTRDSPFAESPVLLIGNKIDLCGKKPTLTPKQRHTVDSLLESGQVWRYIETSAVAWNPVSDSDLFTTFFEHVAKVMPPRLPVKARTGGKNLLLVQEERGGADDARTCCSAQK